MICGYILAYVQFKKWNSDYAFMYMNYYRNKLNGMFS